MANQKKPHKFHLSVIKTQKLPENLQKSQKRRYEIPDCLKGERDICVKTINTAFRCTPP